MSRLASAPARPLVRHGHGAVAGFFYGFLMHNPPSVRGIPGFDKMEHAGALIPTAGWFGVLFRDRFIPLFCVLTVCVCCVDCWRLRFHRPALGLFRGVRIGELVRFDFSDVTQPLNP